MTTAPTRPLGARGARASVVGQGTWEMEHTPRASVDALRRGLDLGLGHVDTAEMYGDGEVERLVGRAIAGRRDEVFLVSKVLPHHASRAGTIAACERSLARLGTDRLDLYLLHWPGEHPLEHTFEAFETLRERGRIDAWGVSNFDVAGLREACRVARDVGGTIACNQVLLHLAEREVEHELLPFHVEHGIATLAYSPLGQGRFPAPGSEARAALEEVGARHGVSAHAVALARLLRLPGVFVIPKASDVAHVEQNAVAAHVTLSEDDVRRLDEALPRRPPTGRLPVL